MRLVLPPADTYININIPAASDVLFVVFSSLNWGQTSASLGNNRTLSQRCKGKWQPGGRRPAAPSLTAYFNHHYPQEPLGADGSCLHFLSFQTKSRKQNGSGT